MPEKDVTVTAEVTVNAVSEDDGMTWENPEETIMADSLINDSLRVSFGSKQVLNSTSTDGMMYAEVISTNQDVIPASSMRVESIESSGNGAYASGARILFDDGRYDGGDDADLYRYRQRPRHHARRDGRTEKLLSFPARSAPVKYAKGDCDADRTAR